VFRSLCNDFLSFLSFEGWESVVYMELDGFFKVRKTSKALKFQVDVLGLFDSKKGKAKAIS
jgi:hypothetical protein